MSEISFAEFAERLFAVNLVELASVALEERQQEIAELNRQQLLAGQDGEGNPLPAYRDPYYAKKKNALYPESPAGIWNLKLTGDLQKAEFATVQDRFGQPALYVGSSDPKAADLERRATEQGHEIFDLQPANLKKVELEILQPELITKVDASLGIAH